MYLKRSKFSRILFALMLPLLLSGACFGQDWEGLEEVENYEEVDIETQEQIKEQTRREYEQQEIKGPGIDKNVWQQVTEGADYTENVPVKKDQQQKQVVERKDIPDFSLNQTWIRVLLVVLILGILSYLILRLFGVDINFFRRKKKFTDAIDIERLEEELPKTELEKYLDRALAEENYRLALRILYLMVIKQLWEIRLIRWKRDKTNRDYLREMRQSSGYGTFSRLTYLYERVWYGDKNISREDYIRLSPRFQSFLGELKEAGK